jgi:nitronate monooxygenase
MKLLQTLGIDLPIIQAPMAGVSTPAMAAAVSDARALGSISVGAVNAEGARRMIAAVRERKLIAPSRRRGSSACVRISRGST